MKTVKAIKYEHGLTQERPLSFYHLNYSSDIYKASVPDFHYASHLGIITKGLVRIRFGDIESELREGDIWITPPWQLHGVLFRKKNTELLVFNFLYDQLGFADRTLNPEWEELLKNGLTSSEHIDKKRALEIAKEVIATLSSTASTTLAVQWLKLHEILLLLMNSKNIKASSSGNRDFQRIYPAVELLRQAPNGILDVMEAAAACGIGRNRFEQLFRENMGISFGQFAIQTRIGNAAADLRGTGFSIKDICNTWGFYDESHFIRIFRKHFSMSPGKYRRMYSQSLEK